MHLLVWLKNVSRIEYSLLHADCPEDHSDLAYYVHKYQVSSASSTPVSPLPTHVADTPYGPQLIVSHPREAFAIGLRGYISTLLPSLKCRMDVQTTDWKDMLLWYVTSYVAKWHDSFQTTGLYSRSVSACQAAV